MNRIHGFDLGMASAGNQPTVRILTSNGTIPIDVLGVTSTVAGRTTAAGMDRARPKRA
jgi:hypothetical protein